MLEYGSQLRGPCVLLPYKDSVWNMNFSSQNCLWGSCWGSDLGRDNVSVTLHQQELYFFFRETMWGSEEEAEQAPPFSPWLWESEVSCRFHSTLGQIRNHSPVCKPPVLQDVGNLEQETTVTHTLTSLSLTPRSPGWGMERLQKTRDGPFSPGLCQSPHLRWLQVRGGHLTF